MLSGRHLASHGLDSKTYRKKYGFPARQPLCAKALSEERSAGAKERGLPENLRKAIDARAKKKVVVDGEKKGDVKNLVMQAIAETLRGGR